MLFCDKDAEPSPAPNKGPQGLYVPRNTTLKMGVSYNKTAYNLRLKGALHVASINPFVFQVEYTMY